jgi:hypothetical protein
VLASLAAICALALTAGPAAAWNTESGGLALSGTITLKNNGKDPKSCTFPAGTSQAGTVFENTGFESLPTKNTNPYTITLSCTGGGKLDWTPAGYAWVEEGASKGGAVVWQNENVIFGGGAGGSFRAPYGPWNIWNPYTTGEEWEWVNASGGTPSHIVLSEELIGFAYGSENPITATGSINFTTLSGGELTLP